MDNTSNPYIAVNAVITAGLQVSLHALSFAIQHGSTYHYSLWVFLKGMEAMSRLPPECCDDPVNNSAMERLPTSLHEAIAAFEADDSKQSTLCLLVFATLLELADQILPLQSSGRPWQRLWVTSCCMLTLLSGDLKLQRQTACP